MNRTKLNWLNSILTVLIIGALLSLFFCYFYDLNDDVLIKDILSGAYAGRPSPMNNQILLLLSFVFYVLYTIIPRIPWYGLLLILFQYCSIVVITDRTLEMVNLKSRWTRILTSVSESALLISLMLSHMFNLQYTYTVAMMAAAATMWILSSDSTKDFKEFLKENIPALVILAIAFNLRSEMLLLMLPFVGMAGFIKWSFERKIFTKENFKKYLGTFAVILGILLVFLIFDKTAYNTMGWDDFREFFDARTELYDFQKIPSYEGNEDFYEGIGLCPEEQVLLENYNFGIDAKIDSDVMWAVADYAAQTNPKNASTIELLKEKFSLYKYEITHISGNGTDYPWNVVNLAMYVMAVVFILLSGKIIGLLDLLVLFMGRSAIWLYMLLGNRMPERITHSLYFIELVVLLGIIAYTIKALFEGKHMMEGLRADEDDDFETGRNAGEIASDVSPDRPPGMLQGNSHNKSAEIPLEISHGKLQGMQHCMSHGIPLCMSYCIPLGMSLICLAFTWLVFPQNASELKTNQAQRNMVNASYNELYNYFEKNPINYYEIDVYSSVAYSEEVFGGMKDVSKANSDLLGGWFCNSPLQVRTEAEYGAVDQESAMLENHIFFVCDDVQDRSWIEEFYASRGRDVEVSEVERIADKFGIYAVREVEKAW